MLTGKGCFYVGRKRSNKQTRLGLRPINVKRGDHLQSTGTSAASILLTDKKQGKDWKKT